MAKKPASHALQRSAQSQPLALPSALEEQSLALIEKTLGGREALVAALSHAPKSRDLEYLLGLIGDPGSASIPLGHLCAQGGITPGELLQAWKAGEILRGHVLATKQIVAALPGVVGDVLRLAAPHEDTCSACQGLGQITPEPTKKKPNPEPVPCPTCQGAGRLIYPADFARVEKVLEMSQLTPKSGGAQVNLNVHQNTANFSGGGAAGGTLEALMTASDRILYGEPDALALPTPPVTEAEVIDAAPPSGADSDPDATV